MTTTLKPIGLILLSSVFAGIGQLFWKALSQEFNLSLRILVNPLLICGLIVYGLAILLMILAFREGELSVLHPFLATSFIWVTLVSPLIFASESIGLFKVFGAISVFLGVSLIGIGGKK